MSYTRVSEKLYQIQLDGKYVDLHTPFGKTEKLFQAFIGNGGVLSADGVVQNDIVSLVSNFGDVATILLSTYGPKGEIVAEGSCTDLSANEVIELFQIATECVENFMRLLSETKRAPEKQVEKEPKAKKMKE